MSSHLRHCIQSRKPMHPNWFNFATCEAFTAWSFNHNSFRLFKSHSTRQFSVLNTLSKKSSLSLVDLQVSPSFTLLYGEIWCPYPATGHRRTVKWDVLGTAKPNLSLPFQLQAYKCITNLQATRQWQPVRGFHTFSNRTGHLLCQIIHIMNALALCTRSRYRSTAPANFYVLFFGTPESFQLGVAWLIWASLSIWCCMTSKGNLVLHD